MNCKHNKALFNGNSTLVENTECDTTVTFYFYCKACRSAIMYQVDYCNVNDVSRTEKLYIKVNNLWKYCHR